MSLICFHKIFRVLCRIRLSLGRACASRAYKVKLSGMQKLNSNEILKARLNVFNITTLPLLKTQLMKGL